MNAQDKSDIIRALEFFADSSQGFTNDCVIRCGELIRKVFNLPSEEETNECSR